MTGFIYGLADPRTLEIRYVGRTINDPWGRRYTHVQHARQGKVGHKSSWIRALEADGVEPLLVIIEQDVPEADITDRERYWVMAGNSWGWRLTNATIGGEGSLRWSDDSRENLSHALKGRVFTEEHREKLRVASTGRRHSPEVIARIVEKNKGRKLSPEQYEAFAQYWKGKTHSEEHRRKVSEAKKGHTVSDETREKISEARKGQTVSDDTKAKIASTIKGTKRSEETRKRMSEAAKRRWALQRGEVV